MSVLSKLAGRVTAARSCALVRVEAVKACALDRVEGGFKLVQLPLQLVRGRVLMWAMEARQAHADKSYQARYDKTMHDLEVLIEKRDYELKVKEYRQWRFDQAEIRCRDIFKRMKEQHMIKADAVFPLPLREGLYNVKPNPLPPVKPMRERYAERLKIPQQYVGLFDGTLKLFTKPVYGVASVCGAVALVAAANEEMKKPGSITDHVRSLAGKINEKKQDGQASDGDVSDGDDD